MKKKRSPEFSGLSFTPVMFSRGGHGSRAVWNMYCLRSLGSRDRGFESHTRHGCLICVFILCFVLCLGRGLATSWSLVQGVLPSVKWSKWKNNLYAVRYKVGYQLLAAAARSSSCAADSFVCLPCSCPAWKRGSHVRLLMDAVPQAQDRLNWKSTTHWNPFAAGQKKTWSDLARHAPSSHAAVFVLPRAATWYRLYEAKQRTLPRAAAARNRYPA
jgi:hypothetical protein